MLLPSALRLCRIAGLFPVLLFAAGSCGGDSTSEPATKPLPVLISITPTSLIAGSGATSLQLNGSGFVRSSQARWNDADRVTHYQDDHTLTMDLSTADVAALTNAKVTVVNGAPGGGTSGVVSVSVGYPVPKITSVTPNSIAIQSTSGPSVPITIVGSGFVAGSFVRIGQSSGASVVSVTPTQINATISPFFLSTPGTLAISISNPSPGGGVSNSVDFSVIFPVPTITVVSPDSALTGAAFTLTVDGTGFGTGTVVRWNGTDRPTTVVSSTRVTAAIPAGDVAAANTASLTVFNPTPGGGTSASVSYRVREAAPVITGISPGVVTAGAGATTVTITGTNFRVGATAQWDGQARTATLTGSTSMAIALTSADLATARVGRLTVTNPGASGISNAIGLAIVAPSPSLAITRSITLTHADVVYDETRGVLYASVPSSAAQNANSVVRIDPASGIVTGTVSVGSNPGPLAITDDGQYLYVGLNGAPKVVRLALGSLTVDLEIPLRYTNVVAEDILPIPGLPRTFAVTMAAGNSSPRNAGTLVFDDDVWRPTMAPNHTGSNRITRSATSARIYGYNNETTEFGFRSVLVASDGLREETIKAGLISGFGTDIEYGGPYVYTTNGEVVDPSAMTKVGTIPTSGVVRPDAANARVHFLNGNAIRTYHYTSFTSIGSFTDPALASHTRMVRWGSDGLAVGGGSTLILLRGGLTAP